MGETENKSSEWETLAWIGIAALVGFVAFVVIPNFQHNGTTSVANACINNLRQIDAAKNEWAQENGKTNGTLCTENDIKSYIKLNAKGNIPSCPEGGTYKIGKIGEPPTCSLGTTVMPVHVLP